MHGVSVVFQQVLISLKLFVEVNAKLHVIQRERRDKQEDQEHDCEQEDSSAYVFVVEVQQSGRDDLREACIDREQGLEEGERQRNNDDHYEHGLGDVIDLFEVRGPGQDDGHDLDAEVGRERVPRFSPVPRQQRTRVPAGHEMAQDDVVPPGEDPFDGLHFLQVRPRHLHALHQENILYEIHEQHREVKPQVESDGAVYPFRSLDS
mmetsp:Transcript_4742/g.9224  ORF Transcript_4742/g.9224 Transcript_4742/m.9224 type:complete len:206 (+) Transcript_4742:598-1215(+)